MSTSGGNSRGRKAGCKVCRASHVKCDKEHPCARCIRRGVPCVYDGGTNFRFRRISTFGGENGTGKYQYSFHEDQPWFPSSAKRIRFIDETEDLANLYADDNSELDETVELPETEDSGSSPAASNALTASTPAATLSETSASGAGVERNWIPPPRQGGLHGFRPAHGIRNSTATCSPAVWDSPGLESSALAPPWAERRGAELMRHFTDHIVATFDLCDPDAYFSSIVPQMALTCSTIRSAIFAVSGKHLSYCQHSTFLAEEARKSFDECAQHITHELREQNLVIGGSLLTAGFLLLFYESVEVPISHPDTSALPHEIWALLHSTPERALTGAWHQAVFFTSLRRAIFVAVINQAPVTSLIDGHRLGRSLEPAEDYVWANRMIVHMLNVADSCFGDVRHPSTYDSLCDYSTAWMEDKPISFSPVFAAQKPREGHTFPEILLLSEAAIVGMQYYHLARILLTAHNPKTPRLGKSQRLAATSMANEIIKDVSVICGIAESVGKINPAYVTACMAVALGGDYFTRRNEQEALFGILTETERVYAWSTTLIQRQMKEAWGWPSDTVASRPSSAYISRTAR